jgi:hypothetical protein
MVMAKKARKTAAAQSASTASSVDELLLAALERGDASFETGRFLITFKEGAVKPALQRCGRRRRGQRDIA